MVLNPALDERSLITVEDLKEGSWDTIPTDLRGDDDQELNSILNATSQRVEEYLDRRIMLSNETHYFEPGEWLSSSHPTYSFEAFLPEWPLVEVLTAGVTVAAGKLRPGGQLIYSNTKHDDIQMITGYMRRDHKGEDDSATLTTLQGLTGMASISVVPNILPDIIRDAVIALAVIRLDARARGMDAHLRKITRVGDGTITIEGADPNAEFHVLRQINAYRKYSI